MLGYSLPIRFQSFPAHHHHHWLTVHSQKNISRSPYSCAPPLGMAKFRWFFSPKRRNMFCNELLAHFKGNLSNRYMYYVSYPTNLVSFQKCNVLYFITFLRRHLYDNCKKYFVDPHTNVDKTGHL